MIHLTFRRAVQPVQQAFAAWFSEVAYKIPVEVFRADVQSRQLLIAHRAEEVAVGQRLRCSFIFIHDLT